ncbi:hypothetical protein ACIGXA_17350 [Streptomyces fildesensis]|uniref:SMODS and SLOG-associating 2TM effector domain-containing protein n=1 Tax=Streptomyces fildesensis TaxID=375757 RepID=A0ABW8C908_9ACTN
MEDVDDSRQDEIIRQIGDAYYIKATSIMSPSRINGASLMAPMIEMEERRADRQISLDISKDLRALRKMSIWSTQIAMFAGLAFIAAAILCASLVPDETSKIAATAISGSGAAVTLFIRTTQMKWSTTVLDHIEKVERVNDERENTRWYQRAVVAMVRDHGPKSAEILIKKLPLFIRKDK